MLIFLAVQDGGAKQLAGVVLVLLRVVFRQQLLRRTVLFVESLDGLQHEGVHHLLVVVPVQALLLQQGVQVGIVLNQRAIQLAPQLAVRLVVVVRRVHIFLVDLAVGNLQVYLLQKFGLIVPRLLLAFHEVVQHLVLFQLQGETVVDKLRRGQGSAFALGSGLGHLHMAASLAGNAHDECQQIVIHVVGFRQTEHQLFFCCVDVLAAVLIVRITQLYYLDSNQFSVNHNSLFLRFDTLIRLQNYAKKSNSPNLTLLIYSFMPLFLIYLNKRSPGCVKPRPLTSYFLILTSYF